MGVGSMHPSAAQPAADIKKWCGVVHLSAKSSPKLILSRYQCAYRLSIAPEDLQGVCCDIIDPASDGGRAWTGGRALLRKKKTDDHQLLRGEVSNTVKHKFN
jgi:hypothetical protein